MGTEVERWAGERTQYSTSGQPLPTLRPHWPRPPFPYDEIKEWAAFHFCPFATLKQKVLWNSRWPPTREP